MSASGPRLLLQSLSIAPLHLLVDVHTAGGSRHIPITVDTHRWAHSPFPDPPGVHVVAEHSVAVPPIPHAPIRRQAACTESPLTPSPLIVDNSHNQSECFLRLTCAAGQAHSCLSQICPAAARSVNSCWASFENTKPIVLWLKVLTLSCRAPVRLSGLQGQQLLFRPAVMLQAAAAHLTAEALMNVPRMLGSLELLLNPTGLLTSVSAGLEDLLGLPFAALVEASPAQV